MLQAFIATLVIAAILLVSELLWKRVKLHPEIARKFVHITVGIFVAFLPFWVEYRWIMIMSVLFVFVNLVNHKLKIFHAIRSVRRTSWGDVLFGVGTFAVACFQPDPWLFAMCILQVGLADGFAAVAGVTYGDKRGKYYLFGQPKTILGSSTFVVVSAVTLVLGFMLSSYFVAPAQMLPVALMLPILLVCVENVSVFGWDNITLPIVTLGILSFF